MLENPKEDLIGDFRRLASLSETQRRLRRMAWDSQTHKHHTPETGRLSTTVGVTRIRPVNPRAPAKRVLFTFFSSFPFSLVGCYNIIRGKFCLQFSVRSRFLVIEHGGGFCSRFTYDFPFFCWGMTYCFFILSVGNFVMQNYMICIFLLSVKFFLSLLKHDCSIELTFILKYNVHFTV